MRDRFIQIYCLFFVLFTAQILLNKLIPEITHFYRHLTFFFLIIFLLINIFKFNFKVDKIFFMFVVWLLLSLSYLSVLGALRNVNFFIYWREFRGALQYTPLIFLLYYFRNSNAKHKIFILCNVLLFLESVIALMQFLRIDFFINVFDLRPSNGVFFDNYYSGVFLPHGTFERYSVFGNIISLIIIYCIGTYFFGEYDKKSKFLYRLFFWLIILLSSTCVFLSGNRMSLISFALGMIFLLFIKHRRAFFCLLAPVVLVMFFVYEKLVVFGSEFVNIVSFDSAIQRYLSFFSVLDDGIGASLSTVRLNLNMLPFVLDNPLFGVGKYYEQVSYGLINSSAGNYTDVYILWLIAEFGLVGLFLFLFPFVFILLKVYKKRSVSDFATIFSCFICLFIQSITDMGIFSPEAGFLFFAFISLEVFMPISYDGKYL